MKKIIDNQTMINLVATKYQKGESQSKISNDLGICVATVERILHNAGLITVDFIKRNDEDKKTRQAMKRVAELEVRQRVWEAYHDQSDDRLTVKEIAKLNNISVNKAYKYINEARIEFLTFLKVDSNIYYRSEKQQTRRTELILNCLHNS